MYYFFFFFNDTATTEIYTLSLHDALPIFRGPGVRRRLYHPIRARRPAAGAGIRTHPPRDHGQRHHARSEEHTSELQSQSNLVCRLLLEKKKDNRHYPHTLV